MSAASRVWSRIMSLMFVEVLPARWFCRHQWRALQVEEIGEGYRYSVRGVCSKCGKSEYWSA